MADEHALPVAGGRQRSRYPWESGDFQDSETIELRGTDCAGGIPSSRAPELSTKIRWLPGSHLYGSVNMTESNIPAPCFRRGVDPYVVVTSQECWSVSKCSALLFCRCRTAGALIASGSLGSEFPQTRDTSGVSRSSRLPIDHNDFIW